MEEFDDCAIQARKSPLGRSNHVFGRERPEIQKKGHAEVMIHLYVPWKCCWVEETMVWAVWCKIKGRS